MIKLWLSLPSRSQEHDTHGGNAIPLADVTEAFGSGGFDIDTQWLDANGPGHITLHLFTVGDQFRRLCKNGGIQVGNHKSLGTRDSRRRLQQAHAVDVFITGIGIWKMNPDISLAGGSEKRVTGGVKKHIRIGVPFESLWEGNDDTTDDKRSAGL